MDHHLVARTHTVVHLQAAAVQVRILDHPLAAVALIAVRQAAVLAPIAVHLSAAAAPIVLDQQQSPPHQHTEVQLV